MILTGKCFFCKQASAMTNRLHRKFRSTRPRRKTINWGVATGFWFSAVVRLEAGGQWIFGLGSGSWEGYVNMLYKMAKSWIEASCPIDRLRADFLRHLKAALLHRVGCSFLLGRELTRSGKACMVYCLGLFPGQSSPRLYDRIIEVLRVRHYSRRTEEAYVHWIRRYIEFHQRRHPRELSENDVNQLLTSLAVKEHVAASTPNQALSAILFLYEHVLEQPLDRIGGVVRARRPKRLPVVLRRTWCPQPGGWIDPST